MSMEYPMPARSRLKAPLGYLAVTLVFLFVHACAVERDQQAKQASTATHRT